MTNSDDRSYVPVNPAGPDRVQAADGSDLPPPAVLTWYRVFCVAMALVYGLLILMGLVMLIAPAMLKGVLSSAGNGKEVDTVVNMVMGGVYVVLGLVFGALYLVGAFLPPRPWTWVTGIVLIALSFTNCCCIPFAIPVLIFWIMPETKTYFQRA